MPSLLHSTRCTFKVCIRSVQIHDNDNDLAGVLTVDEHAAFIFSCQFLQLRGKIPGIVVRIIIKGISGVDRALISSTKGSKRGSLVADDD